MSTADFGGGILTSAGGSDIFIALFDPNGNHEWSRRFGGTDNDGGQSVVIDSLNNVYSTGSFRNALSFESIDFASSGDADIYLAKFW